MFVRILLVNQNILNYFMVELEIEAHFVALQKFLLLQDGEFSQSLCHQLFNKVKFRISFYSGLWMILIRIVVIVNVLTVS